MCSRFDGYKSVDNVWHIHDVDYTGRGSEEIELQIGIDKECFMYYQTFILYVDLLDISYRNVIVENQHYYCWIYR